MKDKILNVLIALSALIILLSLAVIFIFYNPSSVTGHFKKELPKEQQTQALPSEALTPEAEALEEEDIPKEVEERVKELFPVIDTYFVRLKCGVERRSALVLKSIPSGKGVKLYLLTLYPMEWPFTKLELELGSFSPERVYLCGGGVILLEFNLRGFFPPEVSVGDVEDYGVLAVPRGSSIEVSVFKKGECKENGFVFNLAGDFAGVCFGGKFIGARELYEGAPNSCKIIYQSGRMEDGNLQG